MSVNTELETSPLNYRSNEEAAPGRFELTVHKPTKDFDFSALWSTLPGGPLCTPFQSPCFMKAFADAVAPHYRMRLSVCEFRESSSGRPVALIPYAVFKRGPVSVASFPDMGLADLNAPVFARDFPLTAEDFASVWEDFTESLDGVDVVDIARIAPTVGERRNPLYGMDGTETQDPTLCLDLDPDRGAGWKRRSVYKDLRAKERKLAERGVRFIETRDSAQCAEILEELMLQRRRRFSSLGRQDSLVNRPGFADFYRLLAKDANDDGSVTAFCLRDGEEILAAYFALCNETVMNGVLVSIGDDKWHSLSPGMVLTSKIIEWSSRRGIRTYCFGTGLQEYKQRFGGNPVEMRRLCQPLTPLGSLFSIARQLRNGIVPAVPDRIF